MDTQYLSKIWHKTKNSPLLFENIAPQSNKKVWWLGECGHEWELSMYQMKNIKTQPCPYCSNRKVLPGFNDLKTLQPDIATEWHPTKNLLQATEISAISQKKVWWLGECGHEWEAALHTRTKMGTGCPVCAGKITLPGFNDLATLYPEITVEWHPTRNNTLKITPTTINPSSKRKIWWLGECGHEWEAAIGNRARRKGSSGCPVCIGRKIVTGVNDFATLEPEKTKLWHPIKNLPLTPQEIGLNNENLVWWKEKCGHEYQASPYTRRKALKCQVCAGRVVIEGVNDLGTLAPELASQWHPTRNNGVEKTSITTGQPKPYWWQCEKGHEWEASPNDRFRYQTNCPFCANQKVLAGFNDLATTHPSLASEWHPTKNIVSPTQVIAGTEVKIWWQCEKGHEWEAVAYTRTHSTHPTGCPYCSRKRVIVGETDLLTLDPTLSTQWHPTRNGNLTPKEVAAYSSMKVWWQCEKGHEWEAQVAGRYQGRGCQRCSSGLKTSQGEKELLDFVNSLSTNVVTNTRLVLGNNQELDIFLPDLNVAIEYNGLYWHSETAGKDRNYHHTKWKICKEKNIQLIHIWEDDWRDRTEIVKNMLSHKLNKSSAPKLFARKLSITECSNEEAKKFLTQNHIQGWVSSSNYIGLKTTNGVLVALAAFKQTNKTHGKEYYLTRYATSLTVVGGFTKILKAFERTNNPTRLTTFSDNTISNGNLYSHTGFKKDKELRPDYYYFHPRTGKRHHKFLYRLHRFRTDPTLTYVDGFTEKQLAELNSLHRIWDAGKIRWVKEYPNG